MSATQYVFGKCEKDGKYYVAKINILDGSSFSVSSQKKAVLI